MKQTVGFIGGGRVTKVLLQGFKNKNVNFGKIFVNDTDPEALSNLKKQFPEVESADVKTSASQDLVFIALHPPVIMDTLELIKEDIKTDAVVISLAPKINLSRLSMKLGHAGNISRMIPNATSYINEGYNPVTFTADFDKKQKKSTIDLLKKLGNTFEVSEEKLESYAIMSAMLPTYFWFQWKELADIGSKIGLSETEAKESIYNTLVASLNIFYKSGLAPREVIDLIPVKPIGENESQINEIYNSKLVGLFERIKP
jgi:pyrroline-5-carboxylate reductase